MQSLPAAKPAVPASPAGGAHGLVSEIMQRHERMKRDKMVWNSTYQLIGEYIFYKRQDFIGQVTPGQFLTAQIFDGTAIRVLHKAAMGFIGALWPSAKKAFTLKPPQTMPAALRERAGIKQWYQNAKNILSRKMDHPRAGLMKSLYPYKLDNLAFGISGIQVDETENKNVPFVFTEIDTKMMTIAQSYDGFIDTVYKEMELTVRSVVQEYGIENVSARIKAEWKNGEYEKKVRILHVIEPRTDLEVGKQGNANMPYASIHIDMESKSVLRNSGYPEKPFMICRFSQAMQETYGRSPGMECMPDVLEIKSMREATIRATEKILNPPLAVTQDSAMGNGVIDTSPGGLSVRHVSGRIQESQHKWIEPVYTVGDIKPAKERILELQEVLKETFFLDLLVSLLQKDKEMTLGEANLLNNIRGLMLMSVFARQISELYEPMIIRCFNICLNKGLFGVAPNSLEALIAQQQGQAVQLIPQEIVDMMMRGEEVYDIEYISPASRIMRSEELLGIQQTLALLEPLSSVAPGIVNSLNLDRLVARIVELTGAPEDIVETLETVQRMRQAQQQAAQMQHQTEQGHVQAQTLRAVGQGVQAASKAGLAPQDFMAGAAQLAGGAQQQQQGS